MESSLAQERFGLLLRWAGAARPEHLLLGCAGAETPQGPRGAVGVVWDGCLGAPSAAHRLVDLAIASGGRLEVARDACPHAWDGSLLAPLPTLTGGRVTIRERAPEASEPPRTVVSVDRPPTSRRLFGRGEVPETVPRHAPGDDPTTRLVASLRALGGDWAGAEEAAPGVRLAVAGCVACGVCTRACPHDALTLVDGDGTSVLEHHPSRCRGEQACATHCPVGAITVAGPLSWPAFLSTEPEALARVRTRPCVRCGAATPAGEQEAWCDPCRARRAEPFGWDVPPAVRDKLPAHLRAKLEDRR